MFSKKIQPTNKLAPKQRGTFTSLRILTLGGIILLTVLIGLFSWFTYSKVVRMLEQTELLGTQTIIGAPQYLNTERFEKVRTDYDRKINSSTTDIYRNLFIDVSKTTTTTSTSL